MMLVLILIFYEKLYTKKENYFSFKLLYVPKNVIILDKIILINLFFFFTFLLNLFNLWRIKITNNKVKYVTFVNQ